MILKHGSKSSTVVATISSLVVFMILWLFGSAVSGWGQATSCCGNHGQSSPTSAEVSRTLYNSMIKKSWRCMKIVVWCQVVSNCIYSNWKKKLLKKMLPWFLVKSLWNVSVAEQTHAVGKIPSSSEATDLEDCSLSWVKIQSYRFQLLFYRYEKT